MFQQNLIAFSRYFSLNKKLKFYSSDQIQNKLNFYTFLRRKISDLLHVEKPNKGDVYNIPTGRVHAIGAGVLLAEIQQTSDVTYRIFDYNRVDAKTGKTRELHTENALDAIDFSVSENYKTLYDLENKEVAKLVETLYFKTNIRKIGIFKL
ncbi:hypothetical protein [Namhaeicola litoreus]|uniref:Mannose-6-phosphate isomerase n=1 Tax=Namhaeicola litoreus TaxID=1052145 RepID=A0ABW3Y6L5_9FLAO